MQILPSNYYVRTWTTHAQSHSVIPPSALSLPESPQVTRQLPPQVLNRPPADGTKPPLKSKRALAFALLHWPIAMPTANGWFRMAGQKPLVLLFRPGDSVAKLAPEAFCLLPVSKSS
ncbi:hypothetical protein LZ32DRAFT_605063, partial [Colletotrichum eremochloae]